MAPRRTAQPSNSARPTRAVRAQLPGGAEFEREYPDASFAASLALRELEMVGARTERAIAAVCRLHGLSHAALNALAVIEGNAGPIGPGELAERMLVTSGSITSLVDNLERQGLVTRRPDPDDRRRWQIDVTAQAQDLLDVVLPAIQQLAKAIFGSMGDRQIQSLLGTIDDIHSALEDLPVDLPPAVRRRPTRLKR